MARETDSRNFPEEQGLYRHSYEKDACGVGLVCDLSGAGSSRTVSTGLSVLKSLAHRGASGADPGTGDGAGILIQIPHGFFRREARMSGLELPAPGMYATGMFFLPREEEARRFCKEAVSETAGEEGYRVLGWRRVPVNAAAAGRTAGESMPVFEQPFIARAPGTVNGDEFEAGLYLLRKRIENRIRASGPRADDEFYAASLSSRTFSYKGLLKPGQLPRFFTDLESGEIRSAVCLLHARYSTNTFPSWRLAQPFRLLAHNGEINTITGNENWMRAREGMLAGGTAGKRVKEALPVIDPGGSDSASLDNAFELLVMSGRSAEHALMMLMPEAWENDGDMDAALRSFYEFHACMLEPWDGPAAVVFTDGIKAGAALDRNGLRPLRYSVLENGLLIAGSEAGVPGIHASKIVKSGRLEPGGMLVADTAEKRLYENSEIKEKISRRRPYRAWLAGNIIRVRPGVLRPARVERESDEENLLRLFGYTREDISLIIKSMAEDGQEPMGSMGNDTPLAVLNGGPELLFSYFRQRFAQVTNPAIDPIREKSAMSLASFTGPSGSLLAETPRHARRLRTDSPLATDAELEKIISSSRAAGIRPEKISMLFKAAEGAEGFMESLRRLAGGAEDAARGGAGLIVLSDRGAGGANYALPSLLAAGAVHQRLIRASLRTRAGIAVETAEAREVHHFALLLGCGADLVNPYLALSIIRSLSARGALGVSLPEALKNYMKAADRGLLKILSRMGISTVQSYKGAQVFECLGLGPEVVETCFTGMHSRIGGIGLRELAEETLRRPALWGPPGKTPPPGGVYRWRKDGARHLWNPDSITLLQSAVKNNDRKAYAAFSETIYGGRAEPSSLRDLLVFKAAEPVPLHEVEPASSIVKKFAAGAMSLGSLSSKAHETIARAMNSLGACSNTGEGGEPARRLRDLPCGYSLRSRVKQVAAGRFGVTTHYLVSAGEIQIKIAQGAKPGEGGHLPGHKVSPEIARTRHTTPGVTLISPPPHHDIYSIEDLAQLIFDLKNVNPGARISVKLVSEAGVGTVAAGAAKGGADMLLISGGDGGTGAAPLSSIRHAGLPWELGLSETHQTLTLNGLRSGVSLQADGRLLTGRDVAVAAVLGADEFGFSTPLLVSMGCMMLRHCHLDNCAAGIATQDKILIGKFKGRPEHIVNYMMFVAGELREIMAGAGVRRLDDLTGRTELLEVNEAAVRGKAKSLDLSGILFKPDARERTRPYRKRRTALNSVLDAKLIRLARAAMETGSPVALETLIKNSDRAVGAMLSGRICEKFGERGLPGKILRVRFRGTAGQSFGAFLAGGITFELEGAANDYVGKGMFGGRIIIYPAREQMEIPGENIIAGNTAFYGATWGEAYIRGAAGERFCVRNSGITAVCEGAGAHGCEYMTGGTAVILGKTGKNFGAGMSGGVAYVYDGEGFFLKNCNADMSDVTPLDAEDLGALRQIILEHRRHTRSGRAGYILRRFLSESRKFKRVLPREYGKILKERRKGFKHGKTGGRVKNFSQG